MYNNNLPSSYQLKYESIDKFLANSKSGFVRGDTNIDPIIDVPLPETSPLDAKMEAINVKIESIFNEFIYILTLLYLIIHIN